VSPAPVRRGLMAPAEAERAERQAAEVLRALVHADPALAVVAFRTLFAAQGSLVWVALAGIRGFLVEAIKVAEGPEVDVARQWIAMIEASVPDQPVMLPGGDA